MPATITSYVNSYFGAQQLDLGSETGAEFTLTDGTDEIKLHQVNSGWVLLGGEAGWARRSTNLKGGGVYSVNMANNGSPLKHAAFDNVTETLPLMLWHSTPHEMEAEINSLEKLLKVTAPAYWTSRGGTESPVYFKVKLPNSSARYFLITEGRLVFPPTMNDKQYTWDTGKLWPVSLIITHTPFALKAIPGQTQAQVELASYYDWGYNVDWAVEDTSPTGQAQSMLQLSDDSAIYMGGASEIWKYTTAAGWVQETTTPITLSEDITAIAELSNGDILFGGDSRIIKLSSGTYSEETILPSAQIHSILQLENGEVLAGQSGEIFRRDTGGTWASDDTLPSGIIHSFLETSSGFVVAGGVGEILRTKEATDTVSLEIETVVRTDNAKEDTSGDVFPTSSDGDLFQSGYTYHGLRFQNVEIPNGATIVSAKIKFKAQANGAYNATNSMDIYGEGIATPATYSNTAYSISSRTKTTAKVDWDAPEAWTVDQYYYSPELKTLAQEIVDLGGWASGNNMAFLFQLITGSKHRDFYTTSDLSTSPILEISYQVVYAANDKWELKSSLPAGSIFDLYDAGSRVIAGDTNQFLSSVDEGDTWGILNTTPSTAIYSIKGGESDGILYAGGSGIIYKSTDYGINWAVDNNTIPTSIVIGFSYLESIMRAADNGNILKKDSTNNVTLGQIRGTNEVFLANHQKISNLTHVKQDDGGVYTDLFPFTSLPTDFFPASAAINDAVYFGTDTSVGDSSHFTNLVLDIGTIASATTSYTIVWEYYNGSWTTLNVLDESSQFSEAGIGVVSWEPPADWTTVSVDSITGYWVRARVSVLTGTMTSPTQKNRDPYTISLPYAEVANNEILGTFSALLKAYFRNRSDENGVGGSTPAVVQNRIVAGIKPTENHEEFQAYLNFASEQNPDGVTVDVSVDTDSATAEQASSSLYSATGREVFFDASVAAVGSGTGQMLDRVSVCLNTTLATHYKGKYKAFIRCRQNGGTAGEVQVRIKSVFGAGGSTSFTDIAKTSDTSEAGVLEFKVPITLPPTSYLLASEVPSEVRLVIQISVDASDADLYLYDLILIPTDNSWFDTRDLANSSSSALIKGTRSVVDAISIPRATVRSLVQNQTSGAFVAPWQIDSNGSPNIDPETAVKIWVFTLRSTSTSDATWLSEYESLMSLKLWKTEREFI